MSWKELKGSEKRGPSNEKYDYHFPTNCYGFGLNINRYGEDKNWIEMDGNPEEWRILYHGTEP